jgi:hypothetical protein
MADPKTNKSFLISDPRNDAEIRENELVKKLFGLTAGNIKLEIAMANLISHYRAQHKKLVDLTYRISKLIQPDRNKED